MEPKHSAIIKVIDKGSSVDVEFSRPLDVETISAFKRLETHEGIRVRSIPESLGRLGFWILHSQVWDGNEIAKECLKILIEQGYPESSVRTEFRG